jgi:hypothetical protein
MRAIALPLGEDFRRTEHGERRLPLAACHVRTALTARQRQDGGLHAATEAEPGEQGVVFVLGPRTNQEYARRRPNRRGCLSPALRKCFDREESEQKERRGEATASSHAAEAREG